MISSSDIVDVLFIGDPHFQVNNIPEVDIFIDKMLKLAEEKKADLIVVGGDLLHTHERLHTTALNKAYEFIDKLRNISKTLVLVGNHDMLHNGVFLTDHHWMNGMKEWVNTVIVDKVIELEIKGEKLLFVPYVPPGRFEEALNTLNNDWKDASCIFAHQEFSGCKMGAVISIEGDKWPLDYPYVVSGHIHSRQIPQKNIYYSGSAMQHAFGESDKNIIAFLKIKDKKYDLDEIDLGLPRKKIIYIDAEAVDDFKIPETEDKIKITVSGNYEEFKALKKTKKFKELTNKGLKVVFKPKKIELKNKADQLSKNIEENTSDFSNILLNIVNNEKNSYLYQVYQNVINNKDVKEDDILFL